MSTWKNNPHCKSLDLNQWMADMMKPINSSIYQDLMDTAVKSLNEEDYLQLTNLTTGEILWQNDPNLMM